ncbi:hypothetical protein MSUIS_05180 [Mycoplasma suis KI3806]|uniref:Uncharacterized protein n=1 Tax=Mycoplasma suis (strain KI_3806) TaxID=708248 RepID=F0V1T0_MYCS3|nr:hypothetical protein MSUIS_05180 [Mycoplasma suis KI3806]
MSFKVNFPKPRSSELLSTLKNLRIQKNKCEKIITFSHPNVLYYMEINNFTTKALKIPN